MSRLVIKPEFVVDRKGNKKAVIISYKEYQELLEDLEDLKDIAAREKEQSRLFSDYHKERISKRK